VRDDRPWDPADHGPREAGDDVRESKLAQRSSILVTQNGPQFVLNGQISHPVDSFALEDFGEDSKGAVGITGYVKYHSPYHVKYGQPGPWFNPYAIPPRLFNINLPVIPLPSKPVPKIDESHPFVHFVRIVDFAC
jgi:hypothetical protein